MTKTINGKECQGAAYVFTRSGSAWYQQFELIAYDGQTNDFFGWSVSLSADGNTALIGAYNKTISGKALQGAAYVFTRSGSVWYEQFELIAYDGLGSDYFGYSVSLSADGNTALIGAIGKYINLNIYQGAAYVFTRSGSVWYQQKELTANDGAASDWFGQSVALSADGNTALIGAFEKTVNGKAFQGAAYAFTRSGSVWSQQQGLTASDGVAKDYFGQSVSLSSDGNTALIGADNAYNKNMYGYGPGAAYVFTRSGSVWSQRFELIASDGVALDHFGQSVSLSADGNTALIGAENKMINVNGNQGATYVFTKPQAMPWLLLLLSPVNGTCGSASGVATLLPPTTHLCSVGTPSDVTLDTAISYYIWTCFGSDGGSNALCSAPAIPH
jgi:hypothetical protein